MTYTPTTYANFIQAISNVPTQLKVFLSKYSVSDYESMGTTCYMATDKMSGYAITHEFDLISVFSLPGAHNGKDAIRNAVANGAQTLDCIDGFLPTLYSKFGFVEYKRIQWDDAYAPENWDYEKLGRPDIIFMKKK